ncbi:SET domain-containing protein [Gonapodya prolifera JEL478]|uniref:[histone H3]-lysine(4) N-trimethyltransferase n=1 Tax=Gonapodya prolifera (strain JEL478) TaxID=1344416 RepID=A0A139APC9_GONPJ|nr:SET domain-containing protein [Gonapodya prolifera JEL478]|eukprot:KXS18345.1 SET domain-containing protein [Gonapodya prolifera JEL478]
MNSGESQDRNRTPSPHKTGSARTEGYYPLTPSQKPHLRDRSTTLLPDSSSAPKNPKNPVAHVPKISSRAIRSSQRNLVAGLEQAAGDAGEVAGLGQFKERAKKLRFGRSRIHNWGLFAQEPVDAGDIVVEYIGQLIRQRVADQREHQYLSSGIGSSYLFRVDEDTIIDATKMGNLARFINHSCDPNCNAKIINLDGQKKIVIYAKKDIEEGDEITYDYKFPLEAEKLPCYCGSKNCRGSLN